MSRANWTREDVAKNHTISREVEDQRTLFDCLERSYHLLSEEQKKEIDREGWRKNPRQYLAETYRALSQEQREEINNITKDGGYKIDEKSNLIRTREYTYWGAGDGAY